MLDEGHQSTEIAARSTGEAICRGGGIKSCGRGMHVSQTWDTLRALVNYAKSVCMSKTSVNTAWADDIKSQSRGKSTATVWRRLSTSYSAGLPFAHILISGGTSPLGEFGNWDPLAEMICLWLNFGSSVYMVVGPIRSLCKISL